MRTRGPSEASQRPPTPPHGRVAFRVAVVLATTVGALMPHGINLAVIVGRDPTWAAVVMLAAVVIYGCTATFLTFYYAIKAWNYWFRRS